MKTILILGTGCAACARLAQAADRAAQEAGQPYTLEKVTDLQRIMAFGVMSTPALVIDGRVRASGRVPSAAEIKALLA